MRICVVQSEIERWRFSWYSAADQGGSVAAWLIMMVSINLVMV